MDFKAFFTVTADLTHLGIWKNRNVELGGFLALRIEPKTWGDFLHNNYISNEVTPRLT